MRRFKSAAQLQRFASVHGIVQNIFRVGQHLLRSAHHRLLRTHALIEWDAVTRLLRTIGGVDFTGQERAALNKLTIPASAIGRSVDENQPARKQTEP